MITRTNEVYELANVAIKNCCKYGYYDVAKQIDDAMHLGSSGMEILGAIREVFIQQRSILENFMDKTVLDEAVAYIDKAFSS